MPRHLRLISLRLENFQGATEEVVFDGRSATIRGTNGKGKTRRFSAFSWLLFGKDALGRAQGNFDIKNLDAAGEAAHNLEHTVEGILSQGGILLTLRKTFVEVWAKKRGSTAPEFTGHEVKHFIDGVPVLKKDYDARVAEIAPESVFRLLTDPAAFHNLHWEERRALLLEVCGGVSDAEVIASNPALAELPTILGRRSHEQHKAWVKSRRTEINKELTAIPVRIDEATKSLPEVDEAAKPVLEANLTTLREQRTALQQKLAQVEAGGGAGSDERKAIQAAEEAMYQLTRDAKRQADEALETAGAEHRQAQQAVAEARRALASASAATGPADQQVDSLTQLVEVKRQLYAAVDAREIEAHTPDTCTACRQKLPANQVQEAHAKAVADLNAKKAAELEAIQSEGKALRAKLDAATQDRDAKRQAVAEAEQALTAAEAKLAEALLAAHTQAERTQVRIAELDAQQKTLATEFEDLERQLHLLDLFTREKAAMLTDRINSRFAITKFKLFKKNVTNDGLEDACIATVNGVPYDGGLNEAGRINCGLDVIRTLQEHHGFHPPVWVDGAESVVETLGLDTQVIQLVVDGTKPTLSLELHEELEAVA